MACSPWTFRSPAQVHVSLQLHVSRDSMSRSIYIHRSSTLVHDLPRQDLGILYFSPGFSSSKVLLVRHRPFTSVSLRSFGPLHHVPHVWLLVRIYPDLGPLSCWLQKRFLAHFKLVAELVAGEFTPDIRTLTVIA